MGEKRNGGWRGLTPRELELMPLLAQGLTYREMAERQNVAIGTIRQQLHTVYDKLGFIGSNARVKTALWWTVSGGNGKL